MIVKQRRVKPCVRTISHTKSCQREQTLHLSTGLTTQTHNIVASQQDGSRFKPRLEPFFVEMHVLSVELFPSTPVVQRHAGLIG